MMLKTMPLKPRISEKTYAMSMQNNVYVFSVPGDANKLTVANEVGEQFGVSVTNVRILNIKGKKKRTNVKRRRPIIGQKINIKKAYVTLKEGDNIPVFTAIEKAEKDAKKAEEKSKKKVAE